MKNDKTRLTLMAIVTILVLVTAGIYALVMIPKEGARPGNFMPVFILLIIVLFMAFFIIRRYHDIKEGIPLEDERSMKVITQAAAKSFYLSLYWLLAISWFEGFFAEKLFGTEQLDASQTVGGGIAGMAIFFFIFWFYYDRKGKLI